MQQIVSFGCHIVITLTGEIYSSLNISKSFTQYI